MFVPEAISAKRDAQLSQIALAHGRLGRRLGPMQGRQKQSGQDRNDRDHDQ
jgi:hypothetical protein